MDLKEFTSPLPKPWLNINANSVHVGPGEGSANSTVYSKFGVTTIGNTTALSPLSGGNAAAIGSRVLPALPVGASIRMECAGEVTATPATTSVEFFLLVNGAAVMSCKFNLGGNPLNELAAKVSANMTVLGGGIAAGYLNVDIFKVTSLNRVAPCDAGDLPALPPIPFDNTVPNTVDLAIQYSQAAVANVWNNADIYTIELLAAN